MSLSRLKANFKQTRSMQLKASYRDILRIATPLVLANLVAGVGQIIDTAFVNRIGESELNGTVMGSMVWMFFSFILLGFSTYVQRLISKNIGGKKYNKVGPLADNFMALGLGLLGIILLLFYYIRNNGLQWMLKDDQIVHYAQVYLDVVIWGVPFFILITFFSAFFSALGKTYVITCSITVFILVNLVLDYALIFGNFGFPAYGVFGAALATLIAFVCNFLTYLYFVFRHRLTGRFNLFRFNRINRRIITHIAVKSFPLVLQNLSNVLVSWIFFVMIEKMGSSELRISFIVRSLYIFICIPFLGLGKAVNTIISNIIGQGDSGSLKTAILRSHYIGIAISVFLGFIIWAFPELLLGVYTNNPSEIRDALPILNVIVIATFLFSASMINTNIMIGMGDTRAVFLVGALSMICYLAFAYATIFLWEKEITTVWLSEWVNWGMFVFLSTVYFLFARTKQLKLKARTHTALK